jgi:hypothetical protein
MMGFILCLWLVWALGVSVFAYKSARRRGLARWLGLVASFLLLLGATGFFGAAFSAMGGLNWLPNSFEWPVGSVDGVVKTREGLYVVPHTSSGRIQIYDREWRFLHGWHVAAGGGVFKLDVNPEGAIVVFTARGNWRYLFTKDGQLISKEKYSPPTLYSSLPERGERADVPNAPWLWSFTNPLLSWIVVVFGMGSYWLAERVNRMSGRA